MTSLMQFADAALSMWLSSAAFRFHVVEFSSVSIPKLGMLGDYLQVCKELKNSTDKSAQDPSGVPVAARKTRDKLHTLFVHGNIVDIEGSEDSLFHIMLHTMEKNNTFCVRGKQLNFGVPPKERWFVKKALQVMERAASMAIALLDICFEKGSLEGMMEAFHVPSWPDVIDLERAVCDDKVQQGSKRENELMAFHEGLCGQRRSWLERRIFFLVWAREAGKLFKRLSKTERTRTDAGRRCFTHALTALKDRVVGVEERKKSIILFKFKTFDHR